MYTQALNSGGGLAQRLNQHFNKAIRVWDLSAMPFYQSDAGCFFFILGVDKKDGARPAQAPR